MKKPGDSGLRLVWCVLPLFSYMRKMKKIINVHRRDLLRRWRRDREDPRDFLRRELFGCYLSRNRCKIRIDYPDRDFSSYTLLWIFVIFLGYRFVFREGNSNHTSSLAAEVPTNEKEIRARWKHNLF
mmetsp:Transcript_32310/g.78643  ORF Transcript_32310/g.78643 Transcript_32310/m.78643 type:complete len:127 (+) Transcript_32310:91-471(+)